MMLQFCSKFYVYSEGSGKPQNVLKQQRDRQKLCFSESNFPAVSGINQKRGELEVEKTILKTEQIEATGDTL